MKKENVKITFRQLADRQKKILTNQKPVTIEQARAQVKWLMENSKSRKLK